MKVKDVITLIQNIGVNDINKDLAYYIVQCAGFNIPKSLLTQDYYSNTVTVPMNKIINSFIKRSFTIVKKKDFKPLAYGILRLELINRSDIKIRQVELLLGVFRQNQTITEEEYSALSDIFSCRILETITLRVVFEGKDKGDFREELLNYYKSVLGDKYIIIEKYLDNIIDELTLQLQNRMSEDREKYDAFLNKDINE